MSEFFDTLTIQWLAQSKLEVLAAIAAIVYLVLAAKENIWCWLFAFISTALYIYLFYEFSLISESILNVFYLVMAIYGWISWRHGNGLNDHKPIVFWTKKKHVLVIVMTALCVPVLGMITQKLGADYPYLDAFTTCFAVVATFMLVYKVFENWYYWLVIDVVSIYLYWLKGLNVTVLLFAIYVVLIFFGIRNWRKSYVLQQG
ncbi:nicotinamide riboside transporter PnuC [Marinicella sp. W31]|uniref:nicotinamide riboside transporter PnuC n=1 Tax=Marinicella sp. W31 TaxID=3023713 RepID=UPI003757D607